MATRLTRPPTAIQSFVYTTPSIEKANILLGQYELLAATERPGAAVMVACIKNRIEEMSLPGFGAIELSEIPTDAVVRRSEGRNYRIVSGQSHLQAALRLTGRALVTDAVYLECADGFRSSAFEIRPSTPNHAARLEPAGLATCAHP
jgi:hypothetical protein